MNYGILPWILFNLFLLTMLALDLFVFHRRAHIIKINEALKWSIIWVLLAAVFGVFLSFWRGSATALDYFSAYLVEKTLSVDNLFVFLMFFTYFCVPQEYRHKVLFWGILGAVFTRAVFILAGVALLEQIHWVIYLFGAFLIFTGAKMGFKKGENTHPEANPVMRFIARFLPMTRAYHGGKFFTLENGRRLATPLFTVLVAIEATDVIFAVDSIPAVLAITTDPFIVYTSNMFAIMGLRSLYFALSGFAERVYYLHYGLALVLVFLGIKMVLSGIFHIPTVVSLSIIVSTLAISVFASLRRKPSAQVVPGQAVCPFESEKGT